MEQLQQISKNIKKVLKKKKQIKEQPTEDCSICYGQITDQGIIQTCKHTYCFECIEKWAIEKQTCPQCRVKFNKIKRVWQEESKIRQKIYKYGLNQFNFNHGMLIPHFLSQTTIFPEIAQFPFTLEQTIGQHFFDFSFYDS